VPPAKSRRTPNHIRDRLSGYFFSSLLNTASRRVLEKCGFALENQGEDCVVFRRWKAHGLMQSTLGQRQGRTAPGAAGWIPHRPRHQTRVSLLIGNHDQGSGIGVTMVGQGLIPLVYRMS
jgi:hypothetical protein